MGVMTHIYKDVCLTCAVEPQERDLDVMRSRIEHEGLSFLTITLPALGADVELALRDGVIDSTSFRSFRKVGRIPAFLRGIFSQLFDIETGEVKHDLYNHATLVWGLRQLAYVFKKVRIECSESRKAAAVRKYLSSETDLSSREVIDEKHRIFRLVSHLLWNGLIWGFNPYTTTPRHGPGSTADRITGNSKYNRMDWTQRLENYFPILSNAFHNESVFDSEEFKHFRVKTDEEELPVRVVFVPKTLKSPRVIAIEPCCMQYAQQAISGYLIDYLESKCDLTAGHINFTDQSVNQRLALHASRDSSFATIDLSDASDRVPWTGVRDMLSPYNGNMQNSTSDVGFDLINAIDACRSRKALLPDGRVLSLKKFASMGSALCFPVESMYFFTLCVIASLEEKQLMPTYRNVRLVCHDIYVYGDDIIVPTNVANKTISTLQEYYCKVNSSKTFLTGKFRESCGVDAYNGDNVSPIYIRELPPDSLRNAKAIISWVETSNLFYFQGCWQTSAFLRKHVERYTGELPVVGKNSPALGVHSFQKFGSVDRWSQDLFRPEVRAYGKSSVYYDDPLEGYAALTKCLLRLEHGSSEIASDHLARSARHGAVALKSRWLPTY